MRLALDRLIEVEPLLAVTEPPLQVLLTLGTDATCKPAGRLSVNATPFRVVFVFVLVSVKVREVVPLSGIVGAPNTFAIEGGLTTVRLAVDVLPLPASVDRI